MYIIAGLGNPGRKYEGTKHNIGFITVDALADRHGIQINKIKHKALVGEGFISGQKVLLVKPQTYMNLSGQSIREVMAYYKEDPENLLVIYDDVDLSMGRLRFRKGGSAGTHNGMRSIIYDLQQDNFPRLRIGIGGEVKGELASYVLGGFHGSDKELMEEAVKKAADGVECFLSEGIDKAMNQYNTSEKKKKKKEKEEGDQETDE
ncbi:MAG: aminoacyl-tRNA hydrolase [Clostridiales bacterium]|nr:aminoacyl-tRNA hydrolase [Clostridiales bacterium]